MQCGDDVLNVTNHSPLDTHTAKRYHKVKVSSYLSQYPIHKTTKMLYTFFSCRLGTIQPHCNLSPKKVVVTNPSQSIAMNTFILLIQLEQCWVNELEANGSNMGSVSWDCYVLAPEPLRHYVYVTTRWSRVYRQQWKWGKQEIR